MFHHCETCSIFYGFIKVMKFEMWLIIKSLNLVSVSVSVWKTELINTKNFSNIFLQRCCKLFSFLHSFFCFKFANAPRLFVTVRSLLISLHTDTHNRVYPRMSNKWNIASCLLVYFCAKQKVLLCYHYYYFTTFVFASYSCLPVSSSKQQQQKISSSTTAAQNIQPTWWHSTLTLKQK